MSEAMVAIYVPSGRISVPAETAKRLDEWAGWLRGRFEYCANGHCASAEGRYISDRYEPEKPSTNNKIIAPDIAAVLAVERVVNTRLPKVSREIVCRHFVFHDVPQAVARSLGIHRLRYGDELRRSVMMVRNNLTSV